MHTGGPGVLDSQGKTDSGGVVRYKVRFPDHESFNAAQAAESVSSDVSVSNGRRNFISVGEPEAPRLAALEARGTLDVDALMAADPEKDLAMYQSEYGAEIVADYQYSLERSEPAGFGLPVGPEAPGAESLDDVLRQIGATDAWGTTRGKGVAIAIVDTGVSGSRPEFEPSRRVGQWAPQGEDAWTDWDGHGTMCACIAAASRAGGGEFDGVAPEASLIACRTHYYDSELTTIYDYLTDFAKKPDAPPLIASNSFGVKTGQPPAPDPASDFVDALGDAIAAGVTVCFSAGNYHDLAGGAPDACNPTSIWLHKGRADVLTVATSRPDGKMWFYSSRGPGQFAGEPGTANKPDVTAPTPPNGRVLYGETASSLPDGWGTSGACPQVAGLLALLRAAGHDRQAAIDAVTAGAVPLPGIGSDCQGAGVIDCRKSLAGP